MKIIISNKIFITDPPDTLRKLLVSDLRISNPKYESAVKHGYSVYKIPKFLLNFETTMDDGISIPRGYKDRLLDIINGLDIKSYDFEDNRATLGTIQVDSSIILRGYQEKAINELTKHREGVLVAPAGSGKTVIGLSLIPRLGQKMLWITHTTPLFNQVLERAKLFFPDLEKSDIGKIGGGKWIIGDVLTVAMNQTLIRSPAKMADVMDKFGIVVLDEAHHSAASTFLQTLQSFNPTYLYGLTATDERADKLENLMIQTIGPVRSRITMDEVKEESNIIVPTVVYRTLNTQKIKSDDFGTIIKELVYDGKRNRVITEDVVLEARNGNFCIVVTDRKTHAEILYDFIKNNWSKTGIATGNYNKEEVAGQIKLLEDGDITVLVATGALLGEGFDCAKLNRCFLGLPFRNKTKITQIIGRIQRTASGKTDAILYDYVDINYGLLKHQFYNKGTMDCRCSVYRKIGSSVIRI